MVKRLARLSLMFLAATSPPGSAAVAIPALAGSAMMASRVQDNDKQSEAEVAAVPAPSTIYPVRDRPLAPRQVAFACFVHYAEDVARGATGGADVASAMPSSPVALDGRRRRCAVGEQLVAVIDLDPTGGLFAPPANPAAQPGLALGLALLRDARVEIAWLINLPISQFSVPHTSLEQSGLDPREQDTISLRLDQSDAKAQRRDNLADITYIIAIARDGRYDLAERFKYLRNPEAGAGIETLIGDVWFLFPPILGTQRHIYP